MMNSSVIIPSGLFIRPLTSLVKRDISIFSTVQAENQDRNGNGDIATTYPIDSSARTIRHLQFIKKIPFTKGILIQEKIVRAQLDMKELQSKIKKRLNELHEEHGDSARINDNEKSIIDNILLMKPNPVVLTFEFEPTYTGGKRIKKTITQEQVDRFENFQPTTTTEDVVQPLKPKFVQVERGGQITYHGPGQMVAYIILDLKTFHKFPAKCLVSTIEKATMQTLYNVKDLHLRSQLTQNTGVWVDEDDKIASIGIHVRRSITSHGVAINVNPELLYMNSFEMCGLPNKRATSIEEQRVSSDSKIDVQDVAVEFVKSLAKLLGINKVERMQADDMPV
ncbi:lipoyl(octanoyl) transferase LIP2 NDAI_0G02150 [Naumovozyma dairenensis CBS 421]|uniref:Octanoyltransferase n=1 Tax=Naumovozyma dairenensis (strain ATCC 10597 / BCRC 20456 / CBS 421 / NBRC 0211 / NRRL Y-12639) TaxID=1071378 RepID=G0WDX9_NAUDC|nr:hypothetical protein NDAI_0G02150 [Naumovozyma dairenensis CBS 421]CCD25990.2 hypothetical protein NDAI_0G02150 [Naumovozyma dairenensis CBS 421]